MRKSSALLRVLADEALDTAVNFTEACGRSRVTGGDMIKALQYEAHVFMQKDFEEQYQRYLQPSSGWTPPGQDETDSEEEEGSDEDSVESEGDDEASVDLVADATNTQANLHSLVMAYHKTWKTWQPEDPVAQMIKRSIDSLDSQ